MTQIRNEREFVARVQASYQYRLYDGKEETVGQLNLLRRAGAIHLKDLWTTPDSRRQGVATALMMEALEDWGEETIFLEATPFADYPMNVDLLMRWFGRRFGFEETDVRGLMVRRRVD